MWVSNKSVIQQNYRDLTFFQLQNFNLFDEDIQIALRTGDHRYCQHRLPEEGFTNSDYRKLKFTALY